MNDTIGRRLKLCFMTVLLALSLPAAAQEAPPRLMRAAPKQITDVPVAEEDVQRSAESEPPPAEMEPGSLEAKVEIAAQPAGEASEPKAPVHREPRWSLTGVQGQVTALYGFFIENTKLEDRGGAVKTGPGIGLRAVSSRLVFEADYAPVTFSFMQSSRTGDMTLVSLAYIIRKATDKDKFYYGAGLAGVLTNTVMVNNEVLIESSIGARLLAGRRIGNRGGLELGAVLPFSDTSAAMGSLNYYVNIGKPRKAKKEPKDPAETKSY